MKKIRNRISTALGTKNLEFPFWVGSALGSEIVNQMASYRDEVSNRRERCWRLVWDHFGEVMYHRDPLGWWALAFLRSVCVAQKSILLLVPAALPYKVGLIKVDF